MRVAAAAALMLASAVLVALPDGAISGGRALELGRPVAGLGERWRGQPTALRLARRLRAGSPRQHAYADLPLALDLLGCALRAGQPPSKAAAAVAGAVGGPVGDVLVAVSRAADLGASPDVAWQPLGGLISAAAVARTAARTAESGSRLADELADIAADLRARQSFAAEARVRRAGVLVVLPLGLCFLPAFILIGVVPIVIGISGSVLR